MLFVLKELWSRVTSFQTDWKACLALVLFEQIMRLHEFNYIFIKLKTYYTRLGIRCLNKFELLFIEKIHLFNKAFVVRMFSKIKCSNHFYNIKLTLDCYHSKTSRFLFEPAGALP